ncbi:MAG: tyrosine-type recombinase/integrase [Thaumarchaeota archaeon]|nr:tyrosine-type recombinase/integrase [Nitrososphaerota archaeon]
MSIQIQKKRLEIHNYDQRIEALLRNIQQELSPKNSQLIINYNREMIKDSLAKATRRKHLEVILLQSRIINKDWDQVTKEDIDEIVYQIMQKYSPESGQETNCTADHKKVLKIFYRWLKLGSRSHSEVGDPVETKKIRTKKIKCKIAREDLLTEEDLEKLLRACGGSLRNKALIHVQYEAGTRPGELLSLNIKNVKFDQHGAFIHVDGKTGARPVRIVTSVPSLASWLDSHPFREDPEAPVWINLRKDKYGEPMNWAAANKVLKTVCQRARLSKKVTLNLFRHTEATNSAKFMTEAQLRIRHGWTQESKIPANYVHLVNADVDKSYLSHLGIIREENEKPTVPKICHICKMPNSPESDLCNKCGKPLDLKKAIKLEEEANKANFATNKIAGKLLLEMFQTGKIPKLEKSEMKKLITSLAL